MVGCIQVGSHFAAAIPAGPPPMMAILAIRLVDILLAQAGTQYPRLAGFRDVLVSRVLLVDCLEAEEER